MVRKGYTPEQIISKLREAEILLSQGNTIGAVCKKVGISDYTYYRWRKEYGGMRVDQARRLKELEQENAHLKRLIADPSLDNAILLADAPRPHYSLNRGDIVLTARCNGHIIRAGSNCCYLPQADLEMRA